MSESPTNERRAASREDRRRQPRSGRRRSDPRVNWRRLAWLFAAYAMYVSLRSLPSAIKRLVGRKSLAS